ncbi:MAG TPA: RsmE family RNA methyltransferase [Candidatus Dormibacteraeota bacterium]|nr:RsmE family RNA methyltransferase [Candidatus Dormibacteraeota bacterium]
MEGEAAYHLGRVLRAQRGQFYELSDGHRVCLARIEEVKRGRINFSLVEDLPAPHPKLQTTLLLSVVKLNVFEFALEKATELGVNTIVPVAAARSEKALLVATPKRAERWKKILLESSQQSRRTAIPALRPLAKPEIAFSSQAEGLRILLSERPDAPSLHCILEGNSPARGYATATLAIGPEGGWIDAEFQCAQRYGFREASLGQLILRTETAVIAALASLNYALDRQQA